MLRESGILYPISSLPSKYGIGCFSKEAYEFVDFLEAAGQSCWQILPMGPTGFGDSPYASFSGFAGNPYFISPEGLIEDGLLTYEECDSLNFGNDPARVDYGALYNNRPIILKKAHERFKESGKEKKEYEDFVEKNFYWLDDYALYMTIKEEQGNKGWLDWDEEYRLRDGKALAATKEVCRDYYEYICFVQYEFDKQWNKLHRYAQSKKVKIIGDIPFYPAMDSADAWASPEQFLFDDMNMPISVAGTPPDAFSADGQLWGNPLYDWTHMKNTDYSWWVDRIRRNHEFYDVIRIDHFVGFDSYYAVPYGAKNAREGKLQDGPGLEFFTSIKKTLGGDIRIIAEDLGNLTPRIRKMLKDSGFPGMQVLQYAFDGTECSTYLPYKHDRNSVVYTGTHDNMTTRAWIESINDHDRDFARRYINSIYTDYGQFVWDFIREAHRSQSDLCIIPIQDYLVKGNEARINSPGTSGDNWQWRTVPNQLSKELASSIFELTRLYGRLPKEEEKAEEKPVEMEAQETETRTGLEKTKLENVETETTESEKVGVEE